MHLKHWKNCLSIIKKKINAQSYVTWFKPIVPKSYSNKTLTLEVPNQFFYEWIENHYIELLNRLVCIVIGEKRKIKNSISPIAKELRSIKKKDFKASPQKSSSFNNLNRNFRFKSFISGKCNSVAKAAGKRISQNPGDNPFNPLMVYGGVGLGKTHLILSLIHI